jgi:hypothetical protein
MEAEHVELWKWISLAGVLVLGNLDKLPLVDALARVGASLKSITPE